MAGEGVPDTRSSRELWIVVAGSTTLQPKELVELELRWHEDKLSKGLSYYGQQNRPVGEVLRQRHVDEALTKFLLQVSIVLNLEEGCCHNLFLSFLVHEYRGTKDSLEASLRDSRLATALLWQLVAFYHLERVYMLLTLKHVLSYFRDSGHPYEDVYGGFVARHCKDHQLWKAIQAQYDVVSETEAPGNEMNDSGAWDSPERRSVWCSQNLREQCELLEVMLVYCSNFEAAQPSVGGPDVRSLLEIFRRRSFGRQQPYKHLLRDIHKPLLERIGYLQVLVILTGIDLAFLQECILSGSPRDHPLLASQEVYTSVDKMMSVLGENRAHGPILLAWVLFVTLCSTVPELADSQRLSEHAERCSAQAGRHGRNLVKTNVFQYLASLLCTPPFSGSRIVGRICHSLIATLVSLTLVQYDEQSLGDHGSCAIDVASALLREESICRAALKDSESGFSILLERCLERFPLHFVPALQLLTAVASCGLDGAEHVVSRLHSLSTYTEYFSESSERDVTIVNGDLVQRRTEKLPYGSEAFVLPRLILGEVTESSGIDPATVVHWRVKYNGWLLLLCEAREAAGAITVLPTSSAGSLDERIRRPLERLKCICDLISAALVSVSLTGMLFDGFLQCVHHAMHRLAVLVEPDQEVLAACLDVMAGFARYEMERVWGYLQQATLMPFVSGSDNVSAEGTRCVDRLDGGLIGKLLYAHECSRGSYAITLAFLKLVSQSIEPLTKKGKESVCFGPVLFVVKEIFPNYERWRFVDWHQRDLIGQHCLEIFHTILNVSSAGKVTRHTADISIEDGMRSDDLLQSVCVPLLLASEAGCRLLDIVSAGADAIDVALAQQSCAEEGAGTALIQRVQLSLSILNRLLLLRNSACGTSSSSPLEAALVSQQQVRYGGQLSERRQHVIATIAQYLYHRHEPRLPVLATRLLAQIAARATDVSMLACLGEEAASIKDLILSRLSLRSEDPRLKAVLLELMTVCVDTQPGLTEMFLSATNSDSKQSLLDVAVQLMHREKQLTYLCPADLLLACLKFVLALWTAGRQKAVGTLRRAPDFCTSVVAPIIDSKKFEKSFAGFDAMPRLASDLSIYSCILRILAYEMYALSSDELSLWTKTLGTASSIWPVMSKLTAEVARLTDSEGSDVADEESREHSLAAYLDSWRMFTTVQAALSAEDASRPMMVRECDRHAVVEDLVAALIPQLQGSGSAAKASIAGVLSATIFVLLGGPSSWSSGSPNTVVPLMSGLGQALALTSSNLESRLPAVQIGVAASLSTLLRQLRLGGVKPTLPDTWQACGQVLPELAAATCAVLHHNCLQLDAKREPSDVELHVRLHTTALTLMLEVVFAAASASASLGSAPVDAWLSQLREYSVLPALLATARRFIQDRQVPSLVTSTFSFFVGIATTHSTAAEALVLGGLTECTCLSLAELLDSVELLGTADSDQRDRGADLAHNLERGRFRDPWRTAYRMALRVETATVRSLGHGFLLDALSFVGVHGNRMLLVMESVLWSQGMATEAVALIAELRDTCRLLAVLSSTSDYVARWRSELGFQAVQRVLSAVCVTFHNCVALLAQPTLLEQIVHQSKASAGTSSVTPDVSRDDVKKKYTVASDSLTEVVADCSSILRHHSPDLCSLMLDQSEDTCASGQMPFVQLAFAAPSLDRQPHRWPDCGGSAAPPPMSFGTLLACATYCVSVLTRFEGATSVRGAASASTPTKQQQQHISLPTPPSTQSTESTTLSQQVQQQCELTAVLHFALENSLYLVLSQAALCLRLAPAVFSTRDKLWLKRELAAELSSVLVSMQRYMKRTPSQVGNGPISPGPSVPSLQPPAAGHGRAAVSPGAGRSALPPPVFPSQDYYRLLDTFAKSVLK